MKRLLLLTLLLGVALCGRAHAAVCTIPNTISNGNLVDATPVQQNFNALVSCANNIDWSNIDASGIYASQIIPINPGTATFGSGQDYTFSNHLIVLSGVVVDSTAVPGSGIAGGNDSQEFKILSNGGSGAATGFDLVTSTALPSANPILRLGDTNGQTFLEVTSKGDVSIEGGLAFDGTQPDGSSLIGGGAGLPFWLISKTTGSGSGSNFAVKDNTDSIPAVVVENSSASVIFTVDGVGDVQAKGALGVDNQTPPPNGESGGSGTTPFEFISNSNISTTAFEFTDSGSANTNIAKFVSPASGTVLLIDEHGGLSIGASGQTSVEATAASFGGTVQVPTVGPNTGVCTDGGSHLVGCSTPAPGASPITGTASITVSCPSGATVCTHVTVPVTGLTGAYTCYVSPALTSDSGIGLSSVLVGGGSFDLVFGNEQNIAVTDSGTVGYRCYNPA